MDPVTPLHKPAGLEARALPGSGGCPEDSGDSGRAPGKPVGEESLGVYDYYNCVIALHQERRGRG